MKDKHNQEIDELINAYVDGEATLRQQTELKRLMLHDPMMNQRIRSMERQKQLLNALPVEPAPEGLVQEVRAVLERRLILDGISVHQHPAASGALRRTIPAAAVILLPLGLLAFLVYEILKPPAIDPCREPGQVVSNAASPSQSVNSAAELPFNGVLTFRTPQVAVLSAYIEKMIFDQGLMEMTAPDKTPNLISYQVTAPSERIVALLDSMRQTWAQSESASLTVAAGAEAGMLDIPSVKVEQVKQLVSEQDSALLRRLATQFAAANLNASTLAGAGDQTAQGGLPPVDQPILTGRYDPLSVPLQTKVSITLRICIERTAE